MYIFILEIIVPCSKIFLQRKEISLQNEYKCWKNSYNGFAKIQHPIKNTIIDTKY